MPEIYYPEGFFVTTLSADINGSTTTIPTTLVPSRVTKGYMIIEPNHATKREVIHFTSVGVSSVTSADDPTDASDASGRGCTGSITTGANTTHLQGVTVIIAGSEQYWKRFYDTFSEMFSTSTGKFVSIKDANGNELIKHVATSSAVNEITVTNAATGNAPVVGATGDDTDIDLSLIGKGTGKVKIGSGGIKYPNSDGTNGQFLQTNGSGVLSFASVTSDGWTASADTWTYASASTFTIAGVDRTAVFTKGTRLKFTQTNAKYAVVVSSSFSTDTTVTIAVNTDYTIANAAITSPFYSYQVCPAGYPTWFTFAPTFGGFSSDPSGGMGMRYQITGNTCRFKMHYTSDGTSNGTSFTVTIPVAAAHSLYVVGQGFAKDGGSNVTPTYGHLESTATSATIAVRKTLYQGSWTGTSTAKNFWMGEPAEVEF